MRILFINSATYYAKHTSVLPLGILSIATYLQNHGHSVKICDREIDGTGKLKTGAFIPDIVAIAAPSFEGFPDAVRISKKFVKKNIPVVWGGQAPSLVPNLVLESGVVDFVVIGEGEYTFLSLINAIADKTPFNEIAGLAFIDNDEIVINPDRPFADLADFPIIDYSLIKPEKYFVPYIGCEKMLHIYASKGCPHQCTYCYCMCLHKGVWRPRPFNHILSEIKYLVDQHGLDGVCFTDDLFGPSKKHIDSICDSIIDSGMKFAWGCNMRADSCTKEELQKMYDAGCRWILFGIESGSKTRQKLIKKNIEIDVAQRTAQYCKEIGIYTTVTFIIGFPDETEEEIQQSIQYMQALDADAKFPNFCGIIPKTELAESLMKIKRWQAPQTWKEAAKFRVMDRYSDNLSNIKDKELKIILSSFYWVNLLMKYPDRGKSSRVLFKRAFAQITDALRWGTFYSFLLIIKSAFEFIKILFYAKMFPKTLKKYGLK